MEKGHGNYTNKTKNEGHQDGSTRENTMGGSDENKDWVPVVQLGKPIDTTNNIEILSYVNTVGQTPIATLV